MGDRNVTVIPLAEAATVLRLTPAAVAALADSGYLPRENPGTGEPVFRLADLKAFVARNPVGDDEAFGLQHGLDGLEQVDPRDLLDALDGRSGEMARRVFEIFSTVFTEARGWDLTEQARFIAQARARFEAILAVTGQGAEVDEALVGDLEEVGAQAAWSTSPLPQLLVILRISRDLVVQTAVELAEERGRHWGLALSLLLTRVLPAIDRLTDALAQGYWSAILRREETMRARYQGVVEHSSDGVYETDLDGRINYANPSLAVILGRPLDELDGALVSEVIQPLDATTSAGRLLDPEGGRFVLTVARADGVRRVLDVQAIPRSLEDELVGFQGVVRDVEAQALLLSPRPTNLRAAVDAALASVADHSAVVVEVSDAFAVLADRRRLEQVVANLVENAIDHGVPPVVVSACDGGDARSDTADAVVLTVSDSGPGVPEAMVPTLFSGSRPPAGSDRDQSQGPGLGLPMVRDLAEAMGGRVWYQPGPDGGATFRLAMPAARRRT